MKSVHTLLEELIDQYETKGFTVVERVDDKPWGCMVRFHHDDADRFVAEYFPGLDPKEARLGNDNAPLSPKFLVVAPGQRLSWQYHARRAERWAYVTAGLYMRSESNTMPGADSAKPGTVVQFLAGERHRLIGGSEPTIVAEIWQHTEPDNLSDEEDIVRVSDDYAR